MTDKIIPFPGSSKKPIGCDDNGSSMLAYWVMAYATRAVPNGDYFNGGVHRLADSIRDASDRDTVFLRKFADQFWSIK